MKRKPIYMDGRRRVDYGQAIRVTQETFDAAQFDPHALAMALRLANELEWEHPSVNTDERGKWISSWLRREVQRELERLL